MLVAALVCDVRNYMSAGKGKRWQVHDLIPELEKEAAEAMKSRRIGKKDSDLLRALLSPKQKAQ